ncbi:hypothetical protein AC249_AIPGENE24966 [Exaiptasia diaphana]|nr:hypothetical protein AC249_AIPGENE24966 [Exaiptasia diaphana]
MLHNESLQTLPQRRPSLEHTSCFLAAWILKSRDHENFSVVMHDPDGSHCLSRDCRPIQDDIRVRESKPSLINQQSVVCLFKSALCDAVYVGYTRRHLYQRINEYRYS